MTGGSALVFAVIAAVCVAPLVAAQPAGLRFTFTENGLTEMKNIILPLIVSKFQNVQIPDIHMETDVPVIGHITVDLTSIGISGFNIAGGDITLTPPDVASATLDNLNLDLSMDFHWRKVHWPHLSDHGKVDIKPKNGNIDMAVALSTTSDGHPAVNVVKASCTLGEFDIHFSGHWDSWLLNLVTDLLKGTLKKTVQSAVEKGITSAVDTTLQNILLKIPTQITLGGGLSRSTIDIALVNFTAYSSFIDVGDAFAVTNNMTHAPCPIPYAPMPMTVPSNNMIQIMLADASFNCLVWTAYINGAFNFVVSAEEYPKLPLNTNVWGLFFPALAIMYPKHNMSIDITTARQPTLTTDPVDGVSLSMFLWLNTSVVDPTNASLTHVFLLGVSIDFALDVTGQQVGANATIHANVTDLQLNFSVAQSSIGPISASSLQSLTNALTPVIITVVNNKLKGGFPLPTAAGIGLVNPTVVFTPGWIAVASDFAYQSPLNLEDEIAAQFGESLEQ